MAERKVIDNTDTISHEDVHKILAKVSKKPMASSLTMLFKRESNPLTYRTKKDPYPVIYSGCKTPNENVSMVLDIRGRSTHLDIYSCPLEYLPLSRIEAYGCNILAEISAEPMRTGVWMYGKGHVTTYSIQIKTPGKLVLPSKEATWFFNLMKWFSIMTSELNLDVSEQPRFGEGNKEKPN